ncbi:MAG: HAD family phosphatase [Bacteroidales bacterium]|jgi:putative hydrolase of the HAD superfamily|nr:HAD family phosphatase [Bacteroidales bacterium]HOI31383.1 HAD family phosphatase [Bacteroidales bacterium]
MKNFKAVKNIIFDFGGVVLDIDPVQTLNELKKLGFNEPELLEMPEFKDQIMGKFERGILTPETFRNKIRKFLKLDVSDQRIDDAWNALLLDIPKERIKVIEQAKSHYNIFLLSNSNEIHYDVYVRDLQLRFGYREFDQLFHKAYFSFDLHLSKPNPEIFEFVLDQHKMLPEETLFIDDTLEHIESTKMLGFQTYHLQKPVRLRDLFTDGRLKEDLK